MKCFLIVASLLLAMVPLSAAQAKAKPIPAPSSVATPEEAAAIAAGAAGVHLPNSSHLVFVGDSLTAGLPDVNYVAIIREALRARLGSTVRVTNAGVNGDTITRVLARLERDVLSLSPTPTHVFLFLGHNDSKLSFDSSYQDAMVAPEVYEKEYREVVSTIQKRLGAKVTILSATSSVYELTKAIADAKAAKKMSHNLFGQPASLERFNAIAKRVAADFSADYLDVYEPTRRHPQKAELYAKDGVHVNERGNRVLAIEILNYLSHSRHE